MSETATAAAARASNVCIELRGAGKVYPSRRGEVVALQDVSLDIEDGEFVSLLGPSGCGKSTLLKCIAGLEDISNGDLLVRGERVDGPPLGLGMVFQRDLLLDWRTVLDNTLIMAPLPCWNVSVSAASSTAIRGSCPAACANAPRSAALC